LCATETKSEVEAAVRSFHQEWFLTIICDE
jgi:hypothetical protein